MATCRACGTENPDGFRLCGMCGAALGDLPPERRKVATLLFCDLSGSTAMGERLDPESVRDLMFRYFHTMRSALERHGGTVEKFIGDAVVAIFGVPVAHEDDALRAVRAAAEMRERIATLNTELEQRFGVTIAIRMGVNTGEVVAGGQSAASSVVTGDTVNVAARLEQAAAAGEILLGALTHRLVQHAVVTEEVEPIQAKGKAERVPAFRLLSVAASPAPLPRRVDAGLVGREDELKRLDGLFEHAVAESRALVVPVIGEPGVGKSRLAEELSSRLAGRARVLAGRCLSYGEGITFWPLVEIVRQAAGIRDEHAPDEARKRVATLAPSEVTARIAAIVGLGGEVAAEEVGLTVRRLFEALAAQQPLLVVVEDVHWAEPLLLDLLGEVAERAKASMLVVCTARPELSAKLPGWEPAVRLEPLGDRDAHGLVDVLALRLGLSDELAAKVAATSGGNPLFAEELALLLAEDPTASLPASVNAVLTARLDRLAEDERATSERASVEGEIFHRGAVVSLSPERERPGVSEALDGLVAEELIRPARSDFAAEAAFRFKHGLVRDAAYNGTAKKVRADLHERFAEWLEHTAGARVAEYEEVLGYHLEQAHGYLVELGPLDDHGRELGRLATARLMSAAARAVARGAPAAAADLAERAIRLDDGSDGDAAVARIATAADYHVRAGNGRRAFELLDGALADSPSGPRRARLLRGLAFTFSNTDKSIASLEAALAEVGGDARLEADVLGQLASFVTYTRNIWDGEPYARAAVVAAERAGDPALLAHALSALAVNQFVLGRGVSPDLMERALALDPECDSLRVGDRPVALFGWMCKWAGDVDRSRVLLEEAVRIGDESGDTSVTDPLFYSCYLELLAENWQRGLELAERMHEFGVAMEREGEVLYARAVRATFLAHLGDEAGTRRDVGEAFALDEAVGLTHALKLGGQALAVLELSLDRPEDALPLLRRVKQSDFGEGVEEPAMHFSFPMHAEAAIALGELDEAEQLLDWIEERAVRLDREWALACAARCRGLLAAARGDEAGALKAFDRARAEHARVQYRRFDLARTLLAQGETLSAFDREEAARDAREAATAIFDELGAVLWAAKARRPTQARGRS